MSFYLTAILLGLGFSALAIGIFISLRIFNIPDITTDGSFTLGGVVTAVSLSSGISPLLTLPLAFVAGFIAGIFTGIIHTVLKVNALLSGILVMTGLYSINLAVLGRSNLPLINFPTIYSIFPFSNNLTITQFYLTLFFVLFILFFIYRLMKTDFGLAMRATGNNEQMVRACGVNSDRMKIFGLGLANGLTAVSGYFITQIQGFADINMGIGIVILGLGSVMIGNMLAAAINKKSILFQLIGVVIGSIIFRIILAFALTIGIDAIYLKLIVAVFVLVIVSIPNFKKA